MNLETFLLHGQERRIYYEKSFKGTDEEYIELLNGSRTLYITNLNENIEEERLWHLFGICGELRRVIMGVNQNTKTPCGFAFVEYSDKENADAAVKFFKGFELEGRVLAVDKDMGFKEGRQYGRGVFGGRLKSDNHKKRKREYEAMHYK